MIATGTDRYVRAGTPGTWSQAYAEAWNTASIPLTGMLFELKAGTWTTEANAPGSVIFDNFTAALSSTSTKPAPTVSGVSPNSGSTAGGTSVTISGTNFVNGATVTIGGTAATNVAVNSGTTITATTPAHAAGVVNVVVTNPDDEASHAFVAIAERVEELAPKKVYRPELKIT